MAMSIEYLKQKIKSIGDILDNKDILVVSVIILTSFASFGLGRLSKIDESKIPIKIDNMTAVYEPVKQKGDIKTEVNKLLYKKSYVASKNGTKYHFPWCSGAKRIKESNKIWFSSSNEARKAGYSPAGNCKGIQ